MRSGVSCWPCIISNSANAHQSVVDYDVGRELLVLHLLKQRQCLSWPPTLLTSADQSVVGDDVGRQLLVLHHLKQRQCLFWLPTLLTSAHQSVVSYDVGREL